MKLSFFGGKGKIIIYFVNQKLSKVCFVNESLDDDGTTKKDHVPKLL